MNLPRRLVVVASVLTVVGCAARTPVSAPGYDVTLPERDDAAFVHRVAHHASLGGGAGPSHGQKQRRQDLQELFRAEQSKREQARRQRTDLWREQLQPKEERRRLEELLRAQQLTREDMAETVWQFGPPEKEQAQEVGGAGIIMLCVPRDDGTVGRCRPTVAGGRLFR